LPREQFEYWFAVIIPPRFEEDLRAGRSPDIQVNIDATALPSNPR
jgi:ABC-2 type transport system permease protein